MFVFRWMQHYLVQATYWHNPLKENLYKKKSSFIAEINNEYKINQTYINNLQKLKRLIN